MTAPYEKQLPMTLRVLWLISSIEACLIYGDDETVISLCKSMMQFWSSIPKEKRIQLFRESSTGLKFLLDLKVDEN